MSTKRKNTTSHPKQAFFRGLAVLLPSVLTLWLMVKAYQFIDSAIAEPINGGIRMIVVHTPSYFPSATEFFEIGPTDVEINTAAAEKEISITSGDMSGDDGFIYPSKLNTSDVTKQGATKIRVWQEAPHL